MWSDRLEKAATRMRERNLAAQQQAAIVPTRPRRPLLSRSEAARQKPHLHECVCGRMYASRYVRRVLECPRCRRRRNYRLAKKRKADPAFVARRRALDVVAHAWQEFQHIALDLFGPDANLKSSLSGLSFD
ncbi:MAG: hypothetical protein IT165_25335 [Bryobacterales bacterium]|nr:hypothetical protein [Bryobacterales bacterium]